MQVHRQRIHCHDFLGVCAGQAGERLRRALVVFDPRPRGHVVTPYSHAPPVVEFLFQKITCGFWLQAERVPAKVELRAVCTLRVMKFGGKAAQRIVRIQSGRGARRGGRHPAGACMMVPQTLQVRRAASA